MELANSGEAFQGRAVGYNGCLKIKDTNPHTGKFCAFVPNQTTAINKIYQTISVGSSVVHEEKTDITGDTVYDKDFITAGKGDGYEYYFDSIQLDSGSGYAYYL